MLVNHFFVQICYIQQLFLHFLVIGVEGLTLINDIFQGVHYPSSLNPYIIKEEPGFALNNP